MSDKINVAVNALLIKDGKILLGKRLNAVGAGTYAVPGGHVEYGEKLEEALRRELMEETGIVPEQIDFLQVVNTTGGEHYVHLNFLVSKWTGVIENKEPNRCEGWEWFDLNNLPSPIFKPHQAYIEAYKQKLNYYEGSNETNLNPN